MPLIVILHEVDAGALYCVGNYHDGRIGLVLKSEVDSVAQLLEVVSVDFLDDEAEGTPLVGEGLELHDILCSAVDHALVAVDEGDHIGDFEGGSGHSGFPV